MTPQHVPGVKRKTAEQSPSPLQQSSQLPLGALVPFPALLWPIELFPRGAATSEVEEEEVTEVAPDVVVLRFARVTLPSELVGEVAAPVECSSRSNSGKTTDKALAVMTTCSRMFAIPFLFRLMRARCACCRRYRSIDYTVVLRWARLRKC